MSRRKNPPPPECERCGELCADVSPPRRSALTGETLCAGCITEEEDDMVDAARRDEDYVVGIGRGPR